ncbi:acidic phospholipase A2 PLA-1-like [Patiria miniata]|uniref:Phospholipase A2 n=1 Tax=Patiria miniata TaxID=46514 RepID=A0A914AQ09_PATMI|nr:acidic phospholipase A2 PLA-1-like [Patiria miniata]
MANLCGTVFVSALLVCLCGNGFGLVEAGVPAKRADEDVTINSIYQFGQLSMCTTGLSLLSFERDYNGYGCYCGYGGSGNPLDATDNCCKTHDRCYEQSPCSPSALWYTILYRYSKSGCGTAHASITCERASSYPWYYVGENCAEAICNCDKAAALCFNANRSTYNAHYRDHNKSTC